ncbi:MAG: energy transducer TonB [Bryobacteraceae bacterium]
MLHQKRSLLISIALHAAVITLLLTLASTPLNDRKPPRRVRDFTPLVAPRFRVTATDLPKQGDGAGGGGAKKIFPASRGALPRPAWRQFIPPAVPVRPAILIIEPTLVLPPDVELPKSGIKAWGDPLSASLVPSSGPGRCCGIGDSDSGDGGVGRSRGRGYGDGEPGKPGSRFAGGASAPVVIYQIEPEYSEEARKVKYQGTVILAIEVNPSGRPMNIRVASSVGLGLDEKAIEAVAKWRFKPAYKNGKPVASPATIEVNFRLL